MPENISAPVFTDDSGTRKRAVSRLITTLSGILGLGVLAVGLSFFGHVTLPGLTVPPQLPAAIHAKPAAPAAGSTATRSGTDRFPSWRQGNVTGGTVKADRAGTAARSPATPAVAATPAPTDRVTPTTEPTAAPTPAAPTAKPKSTHAATVVHQPGSPPTEPPGQSKKLSSTQ